MIEPHWHNLDLIRYSAGLIAGIIATLLVLIIAVWHRLRRMGANVTYANHVYPVSVITMGFVLFVGAAMLSRIGKEASWMLYCGLPLLLATPWPLVTMLDKSWRRWKKLADEREATKVFPDKP